jgi:hypothetical protein
VPTYRRQESRLLPWKAGSNEAVNNKRPSLLLPQTQFQPLVPRSLCLSRQDSLCHVIDEEGTSIWRHKGFRREKYTKAEQINDPRGVAHTRDNVHSLTFPGSKLFPSNAYNFSHSLPPPTLNFTLSCITSKRIHIVFICSPHSLSFSLSASPL